MIEGMSASGKTNALVRRVFPAALGWSIVLAASGFAGVSASTHPYRALSLGAVAILLTFLSLRGRTPTLASGRYRWIPYAWVALAVFADHRLSTTYRNPLAAAEGQLSMENAVQLVVYALVGLLVLRERRVLLQVHRRPVPKALIITWPFIALISTAWSIIPIFTLVRSLQLVVVASLGLLCVRIWWESPDTGELLFRRTLRLFVQVVSLLAISGFFFGEDWRVRFAWQGVNGIGAATYLSAALVILVVGGRALTRFSTPIYLSQLVLFGVCLYLARTRSVLLALYLAVLAALWVSGHTKIITRYAGLAYSAAGTLLLFLVGSQGLLQYFSRGESEQGLASLNGRIPVWEAAVHDLSAAHKWLLGFGYGSARAILPSQVEWGAGTAHNGWVELLIGIGIVGTGAAAVAVCVLLYRLYRTRPVDAVQRVGFALVILMVVASGASSEALALPGVGFTLIIFFSSMVIARLYGPSEERSQAGHARRYLEPVKLPPTQPTFFGRSNGGMLSTG
jgi:O-antigen ligase